MEKDLLNFLTRPQLHKIGVVERLIAITWWHHKNGVSPVSFALIDAASSEAGYSQINKAREKEKLRKDPRTTSADKGGSFRIQPAALPELDQQYIDLAQIRDLPESNSLVDVHSFDGTRGYLMKVVLQINVSFDYQLFDCCAVMIRRLLETLIIEVYEKLGRANDLKGRDGHFQMFSGLINILENDSSINIGRQSMAGLKSFKLIADSSAHNRRFNACKKDIDDKIDGIRLAITELRQLAFDK